MSLLTLWQPELTYMSQGFWVRISPGSEGVRSSVWPFSASTDRDLSRKRKIKGKYFVSKRLWTKQNIFSKKTMKSSTFRNFRKFWDFRLSAKIFFNFSNNFCSWYFSFNFLDDLEFSYASDLAYSDTRRCTEPSRGPAQYTFGMQAYCMIVVWQYDNNRFTHITNLTARARINRWAGSKK